MSRSRPIATIVGGTIFGIIVGVLADLLAIDGSGSRTSRPAAQLLFFCGVLLAVVALFLLYVQRGRLRPAAGAMPQRGRGPSWLTLPAFAIAAGAFVVHGPIDAVLWGVFGGAFFVIALYVDYVMVKLMRGRAAGLS